MRLSREEKVTKQNHWGLDLYLIAVRLQVISNSSRQTTKYLLTRTVRFDVKVSKKTSLTNLL